MNNFQRAINALDAADQFHGAMVDNEAYVRALQAEELLVPEVQIIRTPEEMEALDPDACTIDKYGDFDFAKTWLDEEGNLYEGHADFLPAVVFASGTQVRAAHAALEEQK